VAPDWRLKRVTDDESRPGGSVAQPPAIVDHGVADVVLVDEQRVLIVLHHRKVAFVEQEPRRQEDSAWREHTGQLSKIGFALDLGEVGENRDRND
jgi:hypothetical protein